jgi:hypothetical protein
MIATRVTWSLVRASFNKWRASRWRKPEEFIGGEDVFGFSGSVCDPTLTSSVVEPDDRGCKVPCDVYGEWFKPRGLKIHLKSAIELTLPVFFGFILKENKSTI